MRRMLNNNLDQRGNRRFKYETAIWHDSILPGRFYAAKICNISKSGICFESDQTLYQGEKIFIGSKNPESVENTAEHCAEVEIKWRKDLQDSPYRFSYGAEFMAPDNPLVRSINKEKLIKQNVKGSPSASYRQDPRAHLREAYQKEIVFVSQNRKYTGQITDISRGGVFIKTENKFSLGQVIELVLKEDKACQELKLKGWVVRLTPNGVGVKFDRRLGRDRRKNSDRRDRRAGIKKQDETRKKKF
jgi:Tfp pilus assembly protein PilZ